jgi:heme exporter protein D
MSNFSEFIHMGGYGWYVWSSYGLALLVLVVNAVLPLIQRRKILVGIARSIRREQRDKR